MSPEGYNNEVYWISIIYRCRKVKRLKCLIGMKTAQAVAQNFRFLCLFFSYFFFGFNPKIQNGYRQYDSKKIRWKDEKKIQDYFCPHSNILNLAVGLSIISVFLRFALDHYWVLSDQPAAAKQPVWSIEDFSLKRLAGRRGEWFLSLSLEEQVYTILCNEDIISWEKFSYLIDCKKHGVINLWQFFQIIWKADIFKN